MAANAIPFPVLELPSSPSYASLTNTPELLSDAYDSFSTLGLTLYASAERSYLNETSVSEYGVRPWLTGGDRDNPIEYLYYSPAAQLPESGIGMNGSASRTTFVGLELDLEKISRLEENWDGEGADKPLEETLETTRELINLALRVASTFNEAKNFFEPIKSAFHSQMHLFSHPGIVATGYKYDNQTTGLLTFDKSLLAINRSCVGEDKLAQLKPCLYPTVDGGVTLKLFFEGRELKCTAMGETIEVIRWKSAESYESDGLWELSIAQTMEHFEWLMK